MPTTRPRYMLTDTGDLREMLDAAARRWPEVTDRKELLLRLVRAGEIAVGEELARQDAAERRRRQREAMASIRKRVDIDHLLSDAAWR